MKRALRGIIIVALAICANAFHTSTQAAPDGGIHATNFLDPLQTAIAQRLAVTTNRSDIHKRPSLIAATNVLNSRTRTLAGDVRLLGTVATLLNTRFRNDEGFTTVETDVLENYSNEAHSQITALTNVVSTNRYPLGASNNLKQAIAALNHADNTNRTVIRRARWLALAFDKLRVASSGIFRVYTAPGVLPGKYVTLYEDAAPGAQTIYYFHVQDNGTMDYTATNPDEFGTWEYKRLTAKTGELSCHPGTGGHHNMLLTFQNPVSGTFTGTNSANDHITGTFNVSN